MSDLIGEQDSVESRALCYSLLIAILLATNVILLRILYGPFLDFAFEIALCYLPAVLLAAMYAWRKLKRKPLDVSASQTRS